MTAPSPVRHGTNEGYVSDRCRCADCREAKRLYMANYRRRKASGTFVFRDRVADDDWTKLDQLIERVGDDLPVVAIGVRALVVMNA